MYGSLDSLKTRAIQTFQHRFHRLPRFCAVAPGRVNLIGEHTDYNEGFVLPMAIDRYIVMAADVRQDDRVQLYSRELDAQTDFTLDADLQPDAQARWSNYVRGVAAGFMQRGIVPPGFDALIDADVPMGGGLSSSAALEVATATLIETLSGKVLTSMEKVLLCQHAEHTFAGTPCGIMDQFTSVMGRRDHLLLLDCRSLSAQPVPLDDSQVTVLIVNSRVRHELAVGADGLTPYAQRRQQCVRAAEALGLTSLRDATLNHLEQAAMDDVHHRRARHVITEIARTLEAAEAIAHRQWSQAGVLMYASHASLRDDYEVSVPELDLLVDLAQDIGEPGGVYGSRMTGAGLGGCTVSLVRHDAAEHVAQRLLEAYEQKTGRRADACIARAADGACIQTLSPP